MAQISTGKRIVFASIPLLIVAALAEVALRATDLAESCPNRFSDSHYWVCDPILHYKLSREVEPFGAPLNSLGFRGPEWRSKPRGVYRILSLGDSCTFGVIADKYFIEQPYPMELERLVERRVGKGRVEVLNAGVPGYNSFQGLLLLRSKLRGLDPDLITVRYGWNDHSLSVPGEAEAFFREPESAVGLFLQDLALRTKLYAFARRLGMELSARRHPVAEQAEMVFSPELSWAPTIPLEQYERNLRRIIEIGRSGGADVWLLTSPWNRAPAKEAAEFMSFFNRVSFDEFMKIHGEYNEALRRVGREMGALVVDMERVYEAHRREPVFIPADVSHPSETGHALEAETLYSVLLERGVIQPAVEAPQ